MNITIRGKDVNVSSTSGNMMSVEIDGIDIDDVISEFTTNQIVNSVYVKDLLDEIGIDAVKDYFNLIDNVD